MELRCRTNRAVARLDDAEFPLEGQEIALGVVLQAGLVAVQDGEFYEFELVLEFVFFDDLVEEFSDVRGRIAEGVAVQFDALCDEFGMSANTAFNIFARTVVRNRRIPFVIEASTGEDAITKGRAAFEELRKIAAENGLTGMTLDEINEEIRLTREGK